MTWVDVLIVLGLICALEVRNCMMRERLWNAICELDGRKIDKEAGE